MDNFDSLNILLMEKMDRFAFLLKSSRVLEKCNYLLKY